MDKPDAEITQLLALWQGGDRASLDEVVPILYKELRNISANYLRKERLGHTLDPTALVNEAYVRLIDKQDIQWESREHFIAMAAQLMRRILINHWRDRNAQKRGGHVLFLTFNPELDGGGANSQLNLEALDEGLNQLNELDPRKARIIELKFFGGLTEDEIAKALAISPATVRRDWRSARTFLYRFLKQGTEPPKDD